MSTSNSYNFKIVLLGEGCVGKTSLMLRYVEDKFNTKHESTLQASFLNKKINVGGKHVNLSIWDTAGQERFHAMGPLYYRASNGAILVYDITDEDSFQKVKNWVKELKKMLGSDIVLAIVGNKLDLIKDRTVPIDLALEYAKLVGAKHYETSAKLNDGIDELFIDLTAQMIEFNDKKNLNRTNSIRRTNVLIVDDDNSGTNNTDNQVQSSSSSRCCGGTG